MIIIMQKGIGTIHILVILAITFLISIFIYSYATGLLLRSCRGMNNKVNCEWIWTKYFQKCSLGNPNEPLICVWIWENEPARPF